mmetsp:Transcript_41538/g.93708  ORF Transcript_41538/g.93708 Transcript_41538/m.93708 type:complete len:493 (-) Transcript_41538:186-1664(-)
MAFDPVRWLQELLVVAIISALFVAAWCLRKQILLLVSGEDKLHVTCLDCVWFSFCRCCGLCTGDWTRWLTRCPCCPKRVRGTNLVKSSGQFCGLTTYSVELKNIVVGDLPVANNRRGNFYLAVECAANPELVTSLMEEALPKVVHFPEVITLRLRWSRLENQVRIVVKALHVVGSTDLCQSYFDPNDVLHWSQSHPERVMRFQMRTIDPSFPQETPSWIALQFSQPTEARDLDHFHNQFDTVRTATSDGHFQDSSITEFKKSYQLLDQSGGCVEEPSEDDLIRLQRLRSRCDCVYCLCNCCTMSGIIGFLIFRLYTASCWHSYSLMTTAYLQKKQFPLSIHELHGISKLCQDKFKGTGVTKGATACRPTDDQVMNFCHIIRPSLRNTTEEPFALRFLVYSYTGLTVKGASCFDGICNIRSQLAEMDFAIYGTCIFLIFFICCCRMTSNTAVRRLRTDQQERRAETNRIHKALGDQTKQREVFETLRRAGHLG